MTTRVLPDVEEAVVAYLLAAPALVLLVEDRIGTTLDVTQKTELPAVRVRRVATTTIVRRHLEAANLQFESYAGSDLAAYDLARLVEGLVDDDTAAGLIGAHGPVVITAVNTSLGLFASADPVTGRPRYIFGRNVYNHPALPE